MSEAKHTPGPWRIGTSYQSIVADGDTGYDTAKDIEPYGGHLVCESVMWESNAHLIAAAPDLLAACEAMVDFGLLADPSSVNNPDSILATRISKQVRAAIVKAKGGAE